MRKRQSHSTPLFILMFLVGFSSFLSADPFKILMVNSYSTDWVWVQEQRDGFLQSLGEMETELQVVDLDAKNKGPEEVRKTAEAAITIAKTWQPDLIFTTDDLVQSEFTRHFINSEIPIVFSGVNMDMAYYGFDKSNNITGVLEREHFSASLNFLRSVVPMDTIRLAIIIDDDPTWIGVVERIREAVKDDRSIINLQIYQPKSWEEFKEIMGGLQYGVDAIGMIGIFRFPDANGKYVDYETVLKWTAKNSVIPDFSFWDTRVERGTLCAVTVNGVAQGKIAGKMAKSILIDKVSPASIQPERSTRGIPMLSLARARELGIPVSSSILLNSRILIRYIWEN